MHAKEVARLFTMIPGLINTPLVSMISYQYTDGGYGGDVKDAGYATVDWRDVGLYVSCVTGLDRYSRN